MIPAPSDSSDMAGERMLLEPADPQPAWYGLRSDTVCYPIAGRWLTMSGPPPESPTAAAWRRVALCVAGWVALIVAAVTVWNLYGWRWS